jgi:hypothetical protein
MRLSLLIEDNVTENEFTITTCKSQKYHQKHIKPSLKA